MTWEKHQKMVLMSNMQKKLLASAWPSHSQATCEWTNGWKTSGFLCIFLTVTLPFTFLNKSERRKKDVGMILSESVRHAPLKWVMLPGWSEIMKILYKDSIGSSTFMMVKRERSQGIMRACRNGELASVITINKDLMLAGSRNWIPPIPKAENVFYPRVSTHFDWRSVYQTSDLRTAIRGCCKKLMKNLMKRYLGKNSKSHVL